MSPTPRTLRRLGQAKRTPNARLTIALATGLALAAPILAASAPAQAEGMYARLSAAAYSDQALPGEGRPPSPGPTDPDGLSF